MILAKDVRDRTGRLLATKGMVLTKQHFLVFKTWGIKEVDILEDDVANSTQKAKSGEQINQEDLNEAVDKMKPHFQLTDLEHPVIKELLRLSAYRQISRNETQ